MKQTTLFRECFPGADACPKQAEYDTLLTRFAEFMSLSGVCAIVRCPPGYTCPLEPAKQRYCKSAKQRVECCKQAILQGCDVSERTDYQQAVLDGREKMR